MKFTKSAVMGITALTTALILSACSTYDRAASYVTEPVVKDVKVGMTKQQVVDIAGQPATSITMVNARGTCSTYLISGTDKKPQNYFVSFDDTGKVLNKGYQSCSEYDTNPQK